MTLWVCSECGCRFAVGILHCPECQCKLSTEEGKDMAKISVHGGPSDQNAESEGSDDVSLGSNSEASPERLPTQPETSDVEDDKPAKTTESHSRRGRAPRSTAGSADDFTTDTAK